MTMDVLATHMMGMDGKSPFISVLEDRHGPVVHISLQHGTLSFAITKDQLINLADFLWDCANKLKGNDETEREVV